MTPGEGQPAPWPLVTELVLCVLAPSLVLGTLVESSRGRLRRGSARAD
ncbi:hypothetical protein ACWGIU_19450 [Streptomyces sp. NPDC054840]